MPGFVYVLSNPSMPGMVKIGKTMQDDPDSRVAQLYTTGVPVPFKVEFACRVDEPDDVEKRMHTAFGPYRVNPKREFFLIEPEQAISILELLNVDDATAEFAEDDAGIDSQDIEAAKQMTQRRPNFNFDEMEIPIGSLLQSTRTDDTVEICGSKRVVLNGTEMTLSAATKQMMGTQYNLAPGGYWTFNGKLLRDIYNDTYGNV